MNRIAILALACASICASSARAGMIREVTAYYMTATLAGSITSQNDDALRVYGDLRGTQVGPVIIKAVGSPDLWDWDGRALHIWPRTSYGGFNNLTYEDMGTYSSPLFSGFFFGDEPNVDLKDYRFTSITSPAIFPSYVGAEFHWDEVNGGTFSWWDLYSPTCPEDPAQFDPWLCTGDNPKRLTVSGTLSLTSQSFTTARETVYDPNANPIPEPATMGLLVTASLLLPLARRLQ